MNVEDFRKLLEQTDDKLSIFANKDTLNKYTFTTKEFIDAINDFLSDEEKTRLFEYSHFGKLDVYTKKNIINSIADDNIKLDMLVNEKITEEMQNYDIVDIIKNMSDTGKQGFLYNQNLIDKFGINDYDLKDIIASLAEETKTTILMDNELINNKLQLASYQVVDLVKELSNEADKDKAIETYQFEKYQNVDIIKTYNDKSKIDILLKDQEYHKYIVDILQTLDVKTLCEFLKQQKGFCKENNIPPYKIISGLDTEKQKQFIDNFEDINLTLNEKREILATLKIETKQNIDASNFPDKYKSALSMDTIEYMDKIVFDFEKNIEDYKGLDNLIRVKSENFTEEQKAKFMKLCDICPELTVVSSLDNDMVEFTSNAKEYKEAEEWIKSVTDSLNPEWSDAQKMAAIDNAIGKRISYSPDFDTEVFDGGDCRAMYKIISSGYGVCNGIAKVEHYILNKVGIESEIISSGTHSFLKIKNIEIPLANGEIAKGNTILDPTWNLTEHRFGGRPTNFCMSYDEARKNDIDSEGKDHKCHKNDEKLQDATLNLDEQSLRNLFSSIGLADKDGNFPIKGLLEKSKQIDNLYANEPEQNITNKFLLVTQTCPEFAKCQNSSMQILKGLLLESENLSFEKSAISRVYDKEDNKKNPSMYVYLCSEEFGEKFYIADKKEAQFVEMTKEEFVQKYECYESDLEKKNRN